MQKKGNTVLKREISQTRKAVAKLKKKLTRLQARFPKQKVKDHILKGAAGKQVKLSSLFGKKKDMILIHNMGKRCPYCTMWADGFNGIRHHLENRAAFVVVSPDSPATQKKFAQNRGWKFKMLSSQGTSFNRDMGFEGKNGDPWPGVSVFQKDRQGKILRVSKDSFGPGDDYCTVWHLFDLLPDGPAGWEPKYKY